MLIGKQLRMIGKKKIDYMPTLRNDTHCQVAQKAGTQTKTCQRVWLPLLFGIGQRFVAAGSDFYRRIQILSSRLVQHWCKTRGAGLNPARTICSPSCIQSFSPSIRNPSPLLFRSGIPGPGFCGCGAKIVRKSQPQNARFKIQFHLVVDV